MSSLPEVAHLLVQQLSGLPERDMRAATLAQKLLRFEVRQGVCVLEWIIRGALSKREPCMVVCGAMIEAEKVFKHFGGNELAELQAAAREARCIAALQWLRSGAAEGHSIDEKRELPLDLELKEMPLGSRRALARRADSAMIRRLALDRDAAVIRNLVMNPKTVESDLLRICSQRPTMTAPLLEVIRHEKSLRRYKVKLALARNPYLDARYAMNILPLLTATDLESVKDDGTLGAIIRLSAQRLIDISGEPQRSNTTPGTDVEAPPNPDNIWS